MQLTYEPATDTFLALTSFDERALPKEAGFWWDADGRKSGRRGTWFTKDPQKAAALLPYADLKALEKLGQWDVDARASIEQSRAVDTTLEIPLPPGLTLYGFQRAGVAYALGRRGTLLAPEMGLGKTVISVALSNCVPHIEKVLIICPMTLRESWRRHWQRWSTKRMLVGVGDGDRLPHRADVVIIHFDVLHKWKRTLDSIEWDLLVVDEAHKIKNAHALRSEQIYGRRARTVKARTAKRVSADGFTWFEEIPEKKLPALQPLRVKHHTLLLTGTPICNRPKELFPIIHFVDPVHWPQRSAFESQFCGGGMDAKGHSNLGELQQRLRATCMYRVLKKDVLTELPKKLREVVVLPTSLEIRQLLAEEAAAYEGAQSEEFKAWLAQLREDVKAAKARATEDPVAYREAVAKLGEAVSAPLAMMSRVRATLAKKKIPFVVAHLKDLLEDNDQKIVCFAHHVPVILGVAEAFGQACVTIYGETPDKQRTEAVDRFQNDPSVRLFMGGIQPAGVGITLTASSHVVFAELDWVPGNVTQAEDRCHRIGQRDNVLVEHLLFEDSLDVKMARDIIEKQEVIDQALDDVENAPERPVIPQTVSALPAVPTAPIPSPARKTSNEIKAALDQEAGGMSAEQTAAVHAGLRLLSAACDGARRTDGAGFNKFDAQLGKDLAMRESLTPRQAALGKRLLRKYQRQLPAEITTVLGYGGA